jgi:GNAT superfamily N-acetyltransferase
MTVLVELLAPEAADDAALVDRLTGIVNRAYAEGEAGIWLPGTERIGADEVAAAIRAGELLGATLDGALVGCGRAVMLDATTGDVGLVSAAPEAWGAGVGRALVRAAEERLAARGATVMQLELLVPRGWEQPHKTRLRGWYERLGYRVVRTAPFGEIAAPGADRLAGPAEFLIFRKPLQPLGGSERA